LSFFASKIELKLITGYENVVRLLNWVKIQYFLRQYVSDFKIGLHLSCLLQVIYFTKP